MAASCLYLKPDALLGLAPLARLWKLVPSSSHGGDRPELGLGGSNRRRRKRRQVAVASVHSNPRILKTNRRTPFGLAVSPYDDEEEEEIGEECEEEDDEAESDFSDVETSYQKQSRLLSGNDNSRKKVESDKIITKTQFRKLSEELELDEKWFPLIEADLA